MRGVWRENWQRFQIASSKRESWYFARKRVTGAEKPREQIVPGANCSIYAFKKVLSSISHFGECSPTLRNSPLRYSATFTKPLSLS